MVSIPSAPVEPAAVVLPIPVPPHEDLRQQVVGEMPTQELKSAALVLLRDAAAVRAAKDFITEVEHPLQQALFLWHTEWLQSFDILSVQQEDAIHSAAEGLAQRDSSDQSGSLHVWELWELVLGARTALMLQEAGLQRLRVVEQEVCKVSVLMKDLGAALTRASLALDEELYQWMRQTDSARRAAESNAATSVTNDPQVERKLRRTLLEESSKTFASPAAITRMSYRPYDPDAPFPPNLLLTRPYARTVKPSDVVTDVCCICTNVIADYGKRAQRAHCLDCDNGFNTTCGACYRIATAAAGSLLLVEQLRGVSPAMLVFNRHLLAVVADVHRHVYHHTSGLTEHALAFMHSNLVSQRYATMQKVLESALDHYRQRASFGIIVDPTQPDDGHPLRAAVTLLSERRLGSSYRRWGRVAPPMKIDEEPTDVAEDKEKSVVAAPPPFSWKSVVLPLVTPAEPWRVPSPAIAQAASLYNYSPPLETVWVTYQELAVVTQSVAWIAQQHTRATGDFVTLSIADSPLWYTVEMGIVLARRCAVGVYHLWEPKDVLDAMQLSGAKLGFVDVHVFSSIVSSIIAQAADTGNVALESLSKVTEKLVVLVANHEQAAHADEMWARASNAFSDVTTAQVVVLSVAQLTDSTQLKSASAQWFSAPHHHSATSPAHQDDSTHSNPALEEWERAFFQEGRPKPLEPTDDNIFAVGVYTSGTSGGKPKGVLTTMRQWHLETVAQFIGICDNSMSAYAPSWATDKHNVWRAVLRGGRTNFHCKSRSIFESIAHAQPTPSMSIVPFLAHQLPNILESIAAAEERRMEAAIGSANRVQPAVRRWLHARAHAVACFQMVEHVLGGRLYILSIGGAAVRPDVLDFLRRTTPSLVMENYGLTECGGVLRDNRPFPGSEVKLVDRPDLGYRTSDKPFPRGEFAVKNTDIATLKEWICDDETRDQLKQRYLDDGYFLTGDIGLQRADGTYEVIDRASAVRKLANGKFFSPERVEQTIMDYVGSLASLSPSAVPTTFSVLSTALRIVACFVSADDADNSTIRVLFLLNDPTDEASEEAGSVPDVLLDISRTACLQRGIPRDEIPAVVYVEEPQYAWSPQNGCLTASRKPNRRALLARLLKAAERQSGEAVAIAAAAVGEDRHVRCIEDVARMIGNEFVPAYQSSSGSVLHAALPDVGCDSLVLSRVPRLIGGLLQKLRAAISPEFEGHLPRSATFTWAVKDLSRFPPLFWTTPNLMRQTLMSLAQQSVELVDIEDAEDAPQPFFSRQVSAVYSQQGANDVNSMDRADSMQKVASESSHEAPLETASNEIAEAAVKPSTPHPENPKDSVAELPTLLERIQIIEQESSAAIQDMVAPWESGESAQHINAQPSKHAAGAATVVLTGAAGFFGSSILVQLLLESTWCGRVLCIVRSKGGVCAADRLWTAVSNLVPRSGEATPDAQQLTTLRRAFDAKVHVVDGNLEEDYFGLGKMAYDATFGHCRLDIIVHVAAVVKSWSADAGLEALRGANVDATLRLCRLAIDGAQMRQRNTAVPLMYVSTVSVMKSQDIARQDDQLSWKALSELSAAARGYYDAYSATKLLAENVVREWALRSCVPLRIFRAPLLTWHTRSGFGNEDDWLCRLLDAVLSTRLAPSSNIFTEGTVYAPVDTAAAVATRTCLEMLQADDALTTSNGWGVVYPHKASDKLNICSVLKIVEEVVALVQHQRSACEIRAVLGGLQWVPAYAWKAGLDAVALTHPTRYHPLLDKGIMELQRSAGIRPVFPVGQEALADLQEKDIEDLRAESWVEPLRKYLLQWYFAANP